MNENHVVKQIFDCAILRSGKIQIFFLQFKIKELGVNFCFQFKSKPN